MNKELNKNDELKELCNKVRSLINKRNYEECYQLILENMKKYPHAPESHNLLGMLLEKQNNHLLAMKHFRAAWALDPTYLPSRQNLEVFGTFASRGEGAYDESECPELEVKSKYEVEYDKNGVGHIVRRKLNEYK